MLQSDTMECSINEPFLTGRLDLMGTLAKRLSVSWDQPKSDRKAWLDISKPVILADTDIVTDIMMLLQIIYESRVSLLKRFTVLERGRMHVLADGFNSSSCRCWPAPEERSSWRRSGPCSSGRRGGRARPRTAGSASPPASTRLWGSCRWTVCASEQTSPGESTASV